MVVPSLSLVGRRLISVVLHSALIVIANGGAFWLRFDGVIPADFAALARSLLPWLLVVRLSSFFFFRLFEGLWRYTSLWDLRNIVLSVLASTAAFMVVAVAAGAPVNYPRSIYIIDAVLLIVLMTGVRLTRRIYGEIRTPRGGRRVLIYGAGDAGELIVRDMRQNASFDALPIGFIDDDHRKTGQRIHGVPVLGGRAQLTEILKRQKPDELLIALPSAPRETYRAIVRALEPHQVRITTLPRLHQLLSGPVDFTQVRQLKVEDLLARDQVGFDQSQVSQLLRGKCILVTGAGGSIGSELCRQIAAMGPSSLVLLERYENSLFQIQQELVSGRASTELLPVVADITDARRLDQVFLDTRPSIVFHAAAHKHVPLMEENPTEVVKNNIRGTRVLAETAARHGVDRFLLISTDKAVNPTSLMGASKRVAELIVARFNELHTTDFAAVRFGNVLGSNGSVVPTFVAQIAKGGPVTVTHPEMKRFFMLIPEAVQLVLHAATLADRAPLFVLDMGEQVKIADLARDLIRLSGLVPGKDVEVAFTGIRPGEKLFEELFGPGERAERSSVEKVFCVRTDLPPDLTDLLDRVRLLEELACAGSGNDLRHEIGALLKAYSTPKEGLEEHGRQLV